MHLVQSTTRRTFTFTPTNVPLPQALRPKPQSLEARLAEMFTNAEASALAGQEPHWFLPLDTMRRAWAGREGSNVTALVTLHYAESRIWDAFSAWRKAALGTRRGIRAVLAKRSGAEGLDGIDEPGLSIWLTAKAR